MLGGVRMVMMKSQGDTRKRGRYSVRWSSVLKILLVLFPLLAIAAALAYRKGSTFMDPWLTISEILGLSAIVSFYMLVVAGLVVFFKAVLHRRSRTKSEDESVTGTHSDHP